MNDLRRTHSALPVLLRNTNGGISSKIYNVLSNGLINTNTNNSINNAQSSKINNNKLSVQIPSANVTSNSNVVIVAQPQLSAIKRALKTFNNENA